MSKILNATCDANGKVTVDGIVITGVTMTSEGKQASVGVVLFEDDKVYYLPSQSVADLKTTIGKTVDALDDIATALNQIATTLTSIGAGMTGPTTSPPPTLATDVLAIQGKVTEINATKAELNTLKGALK